MPPSYEHKLLRLHFAQLWSSWNRSKGNVYRDYQKKEYQQKLHTLFDKLSNEDFLVLTENQIIERQHIISYFFKNLEFLDSSTLNLIPFEIVECLNLILKDWIPNYNSYIIVTSLVNDYNNVSFDTVLVENKTYFKTLIKSVYGLEFDTALIQFNFPKYLVRDYLFGAVMYHELGHFIDITFKIIDSVYHEILTNITGLNDKQKKQFEKYFPEINPILPDTQQLIFHLREYYADVFASQYIENCSNQYLIYHTSDQNITYRTHPSTGNRISFVNEFLEGKNNYFVELFRKSTKAILGKELEIKFKELDRSNFINLIPYKVQDANEIHSMIRTGWDIWLHHTDEMKKANNMHFELSPRKSYLILNNLIEKSIGNYVVRNKWENANESIIAKS